MASIAVLSNPVAGENKAVLPRICDFCDVREDVLHIVIRGLDELDLAMRRIMKAKPKVIVINGGDGSVQAVLTTLHSLGYLDLQLPLIAVLPSGTTNLIAKDMGATGDALKALNRVEKLAQNGLERHVVNRELIRLDGGDRSGTPVLGMFLAAGALTDTLLFCRNRIYPLGLSNGISHFLGLLSGLVSVLTNATARFLPPKPTLLRVSIDARPRFHDRFQVLMVTTLHRLVLSGKVPAAKRGTLQLLAIERRRWTAIRVVVVTLLGKLGKIPISGVHLTAGKEIRLEEGASVLMDGEEFAAVAGKPIILTATEPIRFLDLGIRARVSENDVPLLAEDRSESDRAAFA